MKIRNYRPKKLLVATERSVAGIFSDLIYRLFLIGSIDVEYSLIIHGCEEVISSLLANILFRSKKKHNYCMQVKNNHIN